MPIDASPDDLDALRELVSQLSSERDAALEECRRVMEQNDRLRHLLQQLRRAQFGRKSERLDPEQLQLAIEDLETAVAAEDAEQDKTAQSVETQKKKRRTNRGSLPAHLPRVHVTLAPDSTACPCCHGAMHVIGEETAERLDKISAQYQVIVTHRPKYGCRACAGAIVQAPAQERLIKGGIPTENLVADVVVDKYAWHKPLYRQAQIMRLQGLPVDRSTLAGWVGAAAAEIRPVYLRMKEIVLASAKIVGDETRAPVRDPGRGRTKTGYFWAISRDDRPWGGLDPPAVAYTYAPGRGRARDGIAGGLFRHRSLRRIHGLQAIGRSGARWWPGDTGLLLGALASRICGDHARRALAVHRDGGSNAQPVWIPCNRRAGMCRNPLRIGRMLRVCRVIGLAHVDIAEGQVHLHAWRKQRHGARSSLLSAAASDGAFASVIRTATNTGAADEERAAGAEDLLRSNPPPRRSFI